MIKKLLSIIHKWYWSRWLLKWKAKNTLPPNLAKSLIEKNKPRKLKLLRFNYTRWRPQPKPLRYRAITKNHREKAEATK